MARIEFSFECGARTPVSYVTNIAKAWGYSDTVMVDGQVVPNPQTKAQFCKAQLKEMLLNADLEGARRIAADAATSTIERGTLDD